MTIADHGESGRIAGDVHLWSAQPISDAQVLIVKRSAVMPRAEQTWHNEKPD